MKTITKQNTNIEKGINMDKKQQKKKNFSIDEIRLLIEEYENRRDTFEGKFSNTLTNIKKKEAWQEVTSKVNALGVDLRTVEDIKVKWKNLCSGAKGTFHTYKKSTFKTGGGPPPKPPTAAEEKIINLFEGRPSFEGIDGFTSEIDFGGM